MTHDPEPTASAERLDRATTIALAATLGIGLTEEEADLIGNQVPGLLEALVIGESELAEPQGPPIRRRHGERGDRGTDPSNALVRRCDVRLEEPVGPLRGARVAVKDCIAVAGVPMTAASEVLADHVPDADAEVVARIIASGGEIRAITNMDTFAMGATGETSCYGPVSSPVDSARAAGGSSSGSAAAVTYADLDVALGTDTGGSCRVPAAWSGVVGFKPTHDRLSLRGVMTIDRLCDHVGILGPDVAAVRALLAVLDGDSMAMDVGGWDELRSRMLDDGPADLEGVRIGLLTSGFAPDMGVTSDVAGAVRDHLDACAGLGAEVVDRNLPEHGEAIAAGHRMLADAFRDTVRSGGIPYQLDEPYRPEFSRALREGLRRAGGTLPFGIKLAAVMGAHLNETTRGESYARAANARLRIRSRVDELLEDVDVLALPTTPTPAISLDAHDSDGGWNASNNTTPFNVTGHPAISLPLRTDAGSPIGLMLVGRRGGDVDLLGLARTIERNLGQPTAHL